MADYQGRVIIADDDGDIRTNLGDWFRFHGFEIFTASDGAAALGLIQRQPVDLVVLDIDMPQMTGLEVLHKIDEDGIDATVVILTSFGTVDLVVEAMQAGAFDFISKPYENERLEVVVQKATERNRLRRENAVLRANTKAGITKPIGSAPAMVKAMVRAEQAAASSASILLLGESGTGKEVFARYIHNMSKRANQPYIAVSSIALPDTLLASELFGHEPGGYTDAKKRKLGMFALADKGTIMLDEIGPASPAFQNSLLRVLQEHEIQLLGGTEPIKIDIRVIAATNRDLEESMAKGEFLEDLYYRLAVVQITIPPLRERKEDIPALAYHFIEEKCKKENKPIMNISESTLDLFYGHSWPNNVRELEHAIEHAVIFCDGDTIHPVHLPDRIRDGRGIAKGGESSGSLDQLIDELIESDTGAKGQTVIEMLNRPALELALRKAGNDITKTARLLKYPSNQRKQVYTLLNRYKIPYKK